MSAKNKGKKPEEVETPDVREPEPEAPSHEDTAAAAIHELIEEGGEGGGEPKVPDWYRKAWEST